MRPLFVVEILGLALCLCLNILHAQDVEWVASKGPYAGSYQQLSVNARGDVAVMFYEGGHLSLDGGTSWQRFAPPVWGQQSALLMLENGAVLSGYTIECDPYICTPNGLYRYVVAEEAWIAAGLTGKDILSLARGLQGDLFAVAADPGQPGQLYQSTDGGRTWNSSGPSEDVRQVFVGASGTLFLGVEGRGLYRSADGGTGWERVLEQPAGDHVWQLDLASRPGGPLMAAYSPHLFGKPTAARMYRSLDDGKTWTRVETFPAVSVHALLTHANRFVAATHGQGLYVSADGAVWEPFGDALGNSIVLNLAPGQGHSIWASVAKRGLLRATAATAGWVQTPLERAGILSFSMPVQGSLFAALSVGTIARTSDGGLTWEIVGPDHYKSDKGVQNHRITSFARSLDGTTLYAASTNGVVFTSEDRGETWQASTRIQGWKRPSRMGKASG